MKKDRGKWVFVLVAVSMCLGISGNVGSAGQVPLTDNCQLVTPSGSLVAGTYVWVQRGAGGEYPVPIPGGYEWRYYTNLAGSNSQISILVPQCANPELGLDTVSYTMSLLPAGNPGNEVSGKTFFGNWTNYENVVKLPTYNANTGEFFIRTYKENPVRQTSMQFKNGSNFYFCPGILGPDCLPEPPPLSKVTSTCEQINDTTWLKTDYNKCSDFEVYACDSGCGSCAPLEQTTISINDTLDPGTNHVFECGSTNLGCNICEVKGQRNPCYTMKIGAGGKAYKYCYDCLTLKAVSCTTTQ